MSRFALCLAIPLACTCFASSQTADLTFTDCPSQVVPGIPFQVSVAYTADIHETQHRGVLILEVLDGATEETLYTLEADNSLLGFEGPAGSHTFNVTIPESDPPDSVSFQIQMTVYGFNDWVQAHLETYPTDGTYPYQWSGNGVTEDLYYLGSLIISSTGTNTYCSGATFQTFLLSCEDYLSSMGLPPNIGSVSASDMRDLRRLWYGVTDYEYQNNLAIERYNLGFRLDDLNDARRGDFIQLWRVTESGHSCIFQSWGRDEFGQINRLHYWSSQSSSNGLGYHSESVGPGGRIQYDRLHLARVKKPRASDDWGLRFGDADTTAFPTAVVGELPSPSGTVLR